MASDPTSTCALVSSSDRTRGLVADVAASAPARRNVAAAVHAATALGDGPSSSAEGLELSFGGVF